MKLSCMYFNKRPQSSKEQSQKKSENRNAGSSYSKEVISDVARQNYRGSRDTQDYIPHLEYP